MFSPAEDTHDDSTTIISKSVHNYNITNVPENDNQANPSTIQIINVLPSSDKAQEGYAEIIGPNSNNTRGDTKQLESQLEEVLENQQR